MTKQNIFTVGGTVQASNGLYIPRRADDELLSICRAGNFAYVLTPRQLGKSSLMVRTAQRMTADGVRSVIIDLSQIGVQVTAGEWYLGLLSMLEEQLELDTNVVEWWQARSHLGITQRLTRFFEEVLLKEVDVPIVVFVDEIDTTLSLDFTDDFFAAIRYFYNARSLSQDLQRLSFVLIGVATPGDLIRDPQRTPFNVGHRVDLEDFSFDEALPLAAGLGLPDHEARQVLTWAMKWTGGHPYLTQRLCRVLAGQAGTNWSEATVARVVANTFFGEKSKQDDNLRFVRDMLTERLPATVGLNSLITTYHNVYRGRPVPDEEQSLVKSHLKLSGVVCRRQGSLQVRNRIYREVFNDEWIRLHLPVNWTRSLQRAAAGLILTLLLLAFPLGGYAWHQRNEALKQAQKTENALRETERQRQLAEASRRDADEQREVAEKLRKHAEAESKEAQAQRKLADAQRLIAEARSLEANQLRTVAEERRVEAEHLRKVSDARGLELKANIALADKDPLAASVFLASALTFEDNLERRAHLLDLRTETAPEATPVWISPNNLGIKTASFSPDGQRIAAGGSDGTVHIYEVESGKEVVELRDHKVSITALAFGHKEQDRLAAGSEDNLIRLWDLNTGKARVFVGHSNPVKQLMFHPDGIRLASLGRDGLVLLWDIETGEYTTSFPRVDDFSRVQDISFSSDGKEIYCLMLTEDHKETFTTKRYIGPLPLPRHFDEYGNIRLDPVAEINVAITSDNDSTILARRDGMVEWQNKHFKFPSPPITQLAVTRAGKWLSVIGSDGVLHILENKYGQEVLQVPLKAAGVKTLLYSPGGTRVLLVREDGRIQLWRFKGKESIYLSKSETDTAMAFSPKGHLIARSGANTKIVLHNSETGLVENILLGHTAGVKAINFSLDGKTLVSASKNGEVILWDVKTGAIVKWLARAFEDSKTLKELTRAFTLNKPKLAWENPQDAHEIVIWDIVVGKETMRLVHGSPVTSFLFSPEPDRLVSVAEDNLIRVWDLSTGKQLFSFSRPGEIRSLFFSPDGSQLALYGSDSTIGVWDLSSRSANSKITPVWYLPADDYRANLAFSPDGRLLALAGSDKKVHLYDFVSHHEFAIIKTVEVVDRLAFSFDSKSLAVSDFSSINIWDIGRIQKLFETSPLTLLKEAEDHSSLQVNGFEVSRIPASASSPFEEIGRVSTNEARHNMLARLQYFAIDLSRQPAAMGYLVVYSSPTESREAALAGAARNRDYLINDRGIAAKRVVVMYGGVRVMRQTELWIVPPGQKPPLQPMSH